MEVHPGVFVTDLDTEDWQPDPEVGGGAEEHVLFDVGAVRAGLPRFDEDSETPVWELPAREIMLVLDGEVRVEIIDGPEVKLKPGGTLSLPRGVKVRFDVEAPFKEIWVLADDQS